MPTLSTVGGTLTATPPFDFDQSLRFITSFTPAMGDQVMTSTSVAKAVRQNGQTYSFRVRSSGSVEAPILEYTLYAQHPITAEIRAALEDRITHYLSLKDDLRPFYKLAESDPHFKPVMQKLYGHHQVKFLTPFENAAWAVLSSRNTMAAARTLKNRITEAFGSKIELGGEALPAFPEPDDILPHAPGDLAAVIGNEKRAEYIWNAARGLAAVEESWLRTADFDAVHEYLLDIKGVGAWTAHFMMIRSLGHMERLMAPEKRVIEGASRVYGRKLDEAEFKALAEPYGDYKGYWAYYLRNA